MEYSSQRRDDSCERWSTRKACGLDDRDSRRHRAVATVSGGDSTVASRVPVIKAASLSGAPPLARIVAALRGIFHSLNARVTARSLEPPKLTMPIFLPMRSAG